METLHVFDTFLKNTVSLGLKIFLNHEEAAYENKDKWPLVAESNVREAWRF